MDGGAVVVRCRAPDADAHEKAYAVRRHQVSGQTAIKFAEQLWNRDLSDRDPDGPLPAVLRLRQPRRPARGGVEAADQLWSRAEEIATAIATKPPTGSVKVQIEMPS